MIGVSNNTKWEELRVAMYALGTNSPHFRIKDRGRDELWPWDNEWYYHFRCPSYEAIEWVDIRASTLQHRETIHDRLRRIHLPGIETTDGFRVFGWVPSRQPIAYID